MTTEIKPHSTRVNHTHKKAFPLSDDDLENLGNYLHGHRPAVSKGIHLYQNIFDDANAKENIMKNSSLFNDTYLSSFKDYYSKPSGVSAFDLELAISGMPKNSKLPVPYRNYSLMDGRFGDDAGFTMHGMENNFLGISDGAGGNLMYGYDPRLFSESLMRHCSDLAYTGEYLTSEPKRLLCHAFDRVQLGKCFGSATACVLGIDCRSGRLHSVNIGDSGYVIIRQGCVVYRSRSQALNGDCPRQLDVYPWTASLKRHGLNYTQLSSLDAICQTFELEPDDIVILSTDGLFDNVPYPLIERILSQSYSLQQAANALVHRAVRFYLKPDDILVIMARVIANHTNILEPSENFH